MLSERMKIVPIQSYADLNSGATQPCDSINMKNFHRATFIVQLHALGGENPDFIVYSGASDAATTTALPVRYALGGAAQGTANCDKLAAWAVTDTTTTVDYAITVDHGAADDFMLVIEVEASQMDEGHAWLTLVSADTIGGSTGNYTAIAVLEPRYTGNRSDSALA